MRIALAGLGLISLLVCVAIVMHLESMQTSEVRTGMRAEDQAQQLSGRDASGMAAMDSYSAQSYPPNGPFRGIRITDVIINGPMDSYYGLKKGDVVLQINGLDVNAMDYGSARAQLDEAFQNVATLLVDRDGNKVTLPAAGVKSPLDSLSIH